MKDWGGSRLKISPTSGYYLREAYKRKGVDEAQGVFKPVESYIK
jgi:hypothetical protein